MSNDKTPTASDIDALLTLILLAVGIPVGLKMIQDKKAAKDAQEAAQKAAHTNGKGDA